MPDPTSSMVINSPTKELKCEVAVVGSGPGGAITACLLAEAGRDVLLIEEGPFLPQESCPPFSLEEMVQKYRHGGQTIALGKPRVQYVEGRCVGGGSEINSGLYHRTPPEVLERWRHEFAVEALEEASLLPQFEACEKELAVGYLKEPAPVASRKLAEGARHLGWQAIEIPRWYKYEDASPNAQRQSMTRTYIPRALKARCRLLPETRVESIRGNDKHWSLKCQWAGFQKMQIAAEVLFLSGGAIQTAALLRRSGITHNVGRLRMHPTIKVVAQFDEEVNAADFGVPVHQVKEFAPRFSFGCSISSVPYLALAMSDHPGYLTQVDQSWRKMAIYYAMIAGTGSGSVRCLPGFSSPLVRYHLTREDMCDLSEALRKLSEILFAAGARTLYPSITGGPVMSKPSELTMLPNLLPAALTNLMTIHLFSSCPMGENKKLCATDSFGKVHGFKNLYIADASLLCTSPGVNPQGSIMAIVRRNTLKFLGKL